MIAILSPSKTQALSGRFYPDYTTPFFMKSSQKLISQLRGYDVEQLARLMKMSQKLAELTWERFQNFKFPHKPANARQALLSFKGDVYRGIPIDSYNKEDFLFAQKHLRILSGLYGCLRPLDLIQPYRLEMGARLKTDSCQNLYQFWGERITDFINEDIQNNQDRYVINLASQEYAKSVIGKRLRAEMIQIVFKQKKGEQYKVIAIHAKRARGLMVDFMVKNRIDSVEQIKAFNRDNYRFASSLSTNRKLVFIKEEQVR